MTHCGLNEIMQNEVKSGKPELFRISQIILNSEFLILSLPERLYFFFTFGVTPRMVALGTEACFMKALGLMPTMCLNCLEKW